MLDPVTRINQLTRGTYDISHCMGDLLRVRFKFTTLFGIREAYSTAFSDDDKKARPATIDAALSNSALDSLLGPVWLML